MRISRLTNSLLVATSLIASLYASAAFGISEKELIRFAKSYQVTGDEPDIYSWNDESCGPASAQLVKVYKLAKGRLGGITLQSLCWGAVYTYYEMRAGADDSIKPILQVSSGRSEGFSNWSKSSLATPENKLSKKQLHAIAAVISDRAN